MKQKHPSFRELIRLVEDAMHSEWESLDVWNDLPQQARDKLQKAFPSPAELVRLLSDGKISVSEMDMYKDGEALVFASDTDREIRTFKRKWLYDSNIIWLENLFIHPNHQRKKIGSRVLKNTVDVARQLGVDKLMMKTQDDGGLVWAQAGFLPSSEGEESDLEGQIVVGINDLPDDARDEMMDFLSLHGIWDVADHEYGPQLMIGTRWEGVLDLNDQTQMARLNSFVNK